MNYYPQNAEELKTIIERYEAVSFDIWDTLIARTVLEPEDVFSIIEVRAKERGIVVPDFRLHRHNAVFQVVRANPNLSEIYDALQKTTGISDEDKEFLIRLEIQTEAEVIMPRREMAELLHYAVSAGKRVNLITDMYLPKDIMELLLKEVKIQEYDGLFVSCDYRQLKKETLFSSYKETVQADTYLHIGDNPDSDGVAASEWGIDAALIRSGYSLLKESVFSILIEKAKAHNEKNMVGLFCARLFNSPFQTTGRVRVSNCRDLGWLFIAPIITVFMQWLGRELKEADYDGILFASRDGYLPQKLYGQMKKLCPEGSFPEERYFLTSRALCTQAAIREDDNIRWLSSVKFHGSEQELLHYRFCLDEEEILPYVKGEYKDPGEYIMQHRDRIYAHAAEVRQNYLSYMKREALTEGKRYAFFDFVSSGTCQCYLERFVPFVLEGKYFCRSITQDEKAGLKIDSLYTNDGVQRADSLLYENYRYLETIMTSDAPSLRYIDRNLNAVYDEEVRSQGEIRFVEEVQGAIEYYFQYFSRMCDWDEEISTDMAESLYRYMNSRDVDITCRSLESMRLRDDWVREFAQR